MIPSGAALLRLPVSGLSATPTQLLPASEQLQEEVEDGFDFRPLLLRLLAERLNIFDELVAFRAHLLRNMFQVVENADEIYRENDEADREKHDSDGGNEEENVCVDEGGHGGIIS